jgi:hypothetical protein
MRQINVRIEDGQVEILDQLAHEFGISSTAMARFLILSGLKENRLEKRVDESEKVRNRQFEELTYFSAVAVGLLEKQFGQLSDEHKKSARAFAQKRCEETTLSVE